MLPPSLLYTKALRTGLGTHLQDLTMAGTWTEEEEEEGLHVNVLEMKAVQFECLLSSDHGRVSLDEW